MHRLIAAVAAAALLVGGAVAGSTATASGPQAGDAPSGWEPRPATYGVHVTEDVPVTMSDGTVLRVNVYRPAPPRRTARRSHAVFR